MTWTNVDLTWVSLNSIYLSDIAMLWANCKTIWPVRNNLQANKITQDLHLTYWGQVTHICISRLTIIADNGLSPGQHQAITWTNAGKLLIGPSGTNFSEILVKINTFSFRKMRLKMSSGKRQQFCVKVTFRDILYRKSTQKASTYNNSNVNHTTIIVEWV